MGKLASPSTADVEELARRAIGSGLLEKAGVRVDRDMRQIEASGLHSLSDVSAQFKPELERLGWTVRLLRNHGDRDEDRLELYASWKNGTLRKTPSVAFEFVRNECDYAGSDLSVWDQDEMPDTPATLRARERPWGIRTTGGKSVGKTWKHVGEPLPVFLELARRGPASRF